MWSAFEKLEVFEGSMNSSSAVAVEESRRVVLCKALDGSPFFLVRIGSGFSRTSFRLRYVTFQFDVLYEVDVGGAKSSDNCVRIGCDDSDISRQRVFVESISAVVSDCVGMEPIALIDGLIELFSRPKRDSNNTVTGIWGELLFILSRTDCDEAVMAWHVDSRQVRDFVFSDIAIEIKTTSSGERKHRFSLPQITSAQRGDLLCSIMVEGADAGLSLLELASMVGNRCGVQARKVFWAKFMPIAEGLSDELSLGRGGPRYAFHRALNSIQFFELADLSRPQICSGGKGAVSEVKFSLTL